MKTTHRRWLTATAATVGACALTLGGAVLPAAAAETPDEPTTLNAGADKYELAAAHTDTTVAELKQLEAQGAIKVSDNGFVLHIDDAQAGAATATFSLLAEPLGAAIPGNPAAGSRPGAPVTVYLDFDGETLEGTNWNEETGSASLTFAPAAAVDPAEQALVWAAVAEDYAPFNVNVTTSRPSDDQLYKTSADDNVYGSHVIITDSYDDVVPDAADSSGLAWGGGAGSDYLTGALVFTQGLGGADAAAKSIAETSSHESSHNFGLEHDGIAGSTTGEYYYPTEGLWGPIQGAAFEVPVTQWSNGDYAGATNTEDDLAVMTDRSQAASHFLYATTADGQVYTGPVCVISGDPQNPQPGDQYQLPNAQNQCDGTGEILNLRFTFTDRANFATDQVGNDAANATSLDNDGTFEVAGVIEQRTDVDVFSVVTAGGEFTAAVEVADIGPNLDAKLTLTDSSGAVVAENDEPATRTSAEVAAGLDAEISATVEAGVYYLAVDGVGAGNPANATPANAGGYSDYGSLGNYTLTGAAAELVVAPVVIESPIDGAEVTGGSEVEVTGTATAGATLTLTVGGVVVDEVEVDEDGNWTASVTANQYGNTEIVASQTVTGIAIPETATVTVTAPVDAPTITGPVNGTTTEDTTPDLSGTGIPNATVTVTVTGADGATATGTATVDADGNWTLTLPTELAAGDYTVTATQTINGVTSAAAETVEFRVAVSNTGGNGGGDGGGSGSGDGDLAATGGNFDALPLTLLTAGVLLAAGAAVLLTVRARRSVSLES